MEHVNKNIYYNMNKLMSYNALYSFCMGERGLGKTYAGKKKMIELWKRKRKQSVYTRRTVTEIDNVITIKANKALDKWESSDPSQASADGTGYQWMAIDIDTKVDDITTVKWNGSALTSQDVADAAACGLGAGHLVYWAKAEDFAGGKTKKITLTYEDGNKLDIIVKMA